MLQTFTAMAGCLVILAVAAGFGAWLGRARRA